MRVGWCSAADAAAAATARAAVGKTAVASGSDDTMGNGPNGRWRDRDGGRGIPAFARKGLYPRAPQRAPLGLSLTPGDQPGRAKDRGDAALTMDPPEAGERESGGPSVFTRKGLYPRAPAAPPRGRRGRRPLPLTSVGRVVQRARATLPGCPGPWTHHWDEGRKRGQRRRFSAAAVQWPLQ